MDPIIIAVVAWWFLRGRGTKDKEDVPARTGGGGGGTRPGFELPSQVVQHGGSGPLPGNGGGGITMQGRGDLGVQGEMVGPMPPVPVGFQVPLPPSPGDPVGPFPDPPPGGSPMTPPVDPPPATPTTPGGRRIPSAPPEAVLAPPGLAPMPPGDTLPEFCRRRHTPIWQDRPCPDGSLEPPSVAGPPPPGTLVLTGPVPGASRWMGVGSCPSGVGTDIRYLVAGSGEWNAICTPGTVGIAPPVMGLPTE